MKHIDEYNKRWWHKFLHFLNITTHDELIDLVIDVLELDTLALKINKDLKQINNGFKAQDKLNRLIAERLHMDKEVMDMNKERQMYG